MYIDNLLKGFTVIKRLFQLLTIIAVIAIAVSCARESAPVGGKKDVTPPVILQSTPPNGSPGFKGNKFELKFSEFVVLDKISEQLLISPPVKQNPDFKLKGKSLVVKFKSELKSNTTYSVYFGDAIVDLTEGNPIHNYTYLFSTGDHVDSLSLMGNVVNAFNLQPADGVMVMLYRDDNDTIPLDSLPLKVPPYYLSKTDKNGDYHLFGLADDSYLVFALNDLNSNYIFDQPSEEIAFIDTVVRPMYEAPAKVDTTVVSDGSAIEIDSVTNLVSDSLMLDTIQKSEGITPIKLFMYEQADTVQRLMEAKLTALNTIRFIFSNPADEVSINAINFSQRDQWHVNRWSKEHDTLWWYLHEADVTVDTLDLVLMNQNDTLGNVFIATKPRDKRVGSRNKKKISKRKDVLDYSTNMNGGLAPISRLYLKFEQPIKTILNDSILFVAGEDSTYAPSFEPQDSLHLKYLFPVKLQEGLKYHLILPDSCFIDWNGYFNKAKALSFSAKEVKEFGTLTINLQPKINGTFLFQLLNKKEDVLHQIKFTSDTSILMEYLAPGNYKLKIITDKNNNVKWDPGNYAKKLEPEYVTYYGKLINIRANWELEETWQFKPDELSPAPGKSVKKKNR